MGGFWLRVFVVRMRQLEEFYKTVTAYMCVFVKDSTSSSSPWCWWRLPLNRASRYSAPGCFFAAVRRVFFCVFWRYVDWWGHPWVMQMAFCMLKSVLVCLLVELQIFVRPIFCSPLPHRRSPTAPPAPSAAEQDGKGLAAAPHGPISSSTLSQLWLAAQFVVLVSVASAAQSFSLSEGLRSDGPCTE